MPNVIVVKKVAVPVMVGNVPVPVDPAQFVPRSLLNGTLAESFNCLPSSDGVTVTATLASKTGGNLTMQFSDGLTTLDCSTTPCTVTLTPGSATVLQKNYIYIPIATKALTVSLTGWPTGEHIKISFQCLFTAVTVQTEDAFVHQDINDELHGTDGMGHITHIGQLLRQGRGWFSGIDGAGTNGYLTIGAGTATIQTTGGVYLQMHTHNYIAKNTATGDDIHVVNDFYTPFREITDITSITEDSNGVSLNNKFFNVVLAGVANKGGQYSPLLLLLPSGGYNKESAAIQDTEGLTSTSLPREFTKDSSNGFLITRLTVKLSGGNITLISTEDLRGVASGSGGAGNAALTEFPDSVFRIQNTTDPTKQIAFTGNEITAGTTRTITVPDKEIDLGDFLTPTVGGISRDSNVYSNGAITSVDFSDMYDNLDPDDDHNVAIWIFGTAIIGAGGITLFAAPPAGVERYGVIRIDFTNPPKFDELAWPAGKNLTQGGTVPVFDAGTKYADVLIRRNSLGIFYNVNPWSA